MIAVTDPDTRIDIYMGSGGAPEGVLAAAALRCVGGQIQGRLLFRNDDERGRAAALGDRGPRPHLQARGHGQRRLHLRRHRGHRRLAARRGQAPPRRCVETDSIVMRASSGTVRRVKGEHRKGSRLISVPIAANALYYSRMTPEIDPPLLAVEPSYRHVIRARLAASWLPLAIGAVVADQLVLRDTPFSWRGVDRRAAARLAGRQRSSRSASTAASATG